MVDVIDLPPGGAGGNHYIKTASYGTGIVTLTAPFDGGMSLIIEASNEGGTFQMPSVSVELPYTSETGRLLPDGTWEAPVVALQTYFGDPRHPQQMPWRVVGATTPDPVTITVQAGDVITVHVSAPSGAYVRWGMTTTTAAPSEWISARFGDYVTHDGTTLPSGATVDEAADIRAHAAAWPLGDLVLGQRPDDLAHNSDDLAGNPLARRKTRWDLTTSQSGTTASASSVIDWEPIEPYLDAATHGGIVGTDGGYVQRATDSFPDQYGLINNMGGRVLFDPASAKTITELGTTLRLIRQQAYALHDYRREDSVYKDGTTTWYPRSEANTRTKDYLSDMRPVVARAEQGALESYRPWYDPADPGYTPFSDAGRLVRALTWKVEWSSGEVGPPKEVYNLYRWTHSVTTNRSARDPFAGRTLPFNQIETNPDYPASSPWPTVDVDLTVRIYRVDVEVTDAAWVPPEVISSGELVDEFGFPSQSVVATPPVLRLDGPTKDRDIGFGTYAFEDALYQSDVFAGGRPGSGAKLYDNVYAMLASPYEASYFPWGPSIGAYWDARGYVNGPPSQFANGSFYYSWDTSASFRTMAARRYPDQFRVALWVPALVPLVLQTRKPRFFVTYTEVEDEPRAVSHVVGIGKPETDLSIFRVPTPLGTYRELRHGEKPSETSLTHPLKVKLEDGSWTVVAGMTLDD